MPGKHSGRPSVCGGSGKRRCSSKGTFILHGREKYIIGSFLWDKLLLRSVYRLQLLKSKLLRLVGEILSPNPPLAALNSFTFFWKGSWLLLSMCSMESPQPWCQPWDTDPGTVLPLDWTNSSWSTQSVLPSCCGSAILCMRKFPWFKHLDNSLVG